MKSFPDLEVTQKALDLTEEIYRLTALLPKEEMYGMSSQLKKASSSIVANIAEGFGRYTYADKAHKYVIARGECTEVVAFLYVAIRIGLLKNEATKRAFELADRTGQMLSKLIQSCRKLEKNPNSESRIPNLEDYAE